MGISVFLDSTSHSFQLFYPITFAIPPDLSFIMMLIEDYKTDKVQGQKWKTEEEKGECVVL